MESPYLVHMCRFSSLYIYVVRYLQKIIPADFDMCKNRSHYRMPDDVFGQDDARVLSSCTTLGGPA